MAQISFFKNAMLTLTSEQTEIISRTVSLWKSGLTFDSSVLYEVEPYD